MLGKWVKYSRVAGAAVSTDGLSYFTTCSSLFTVSDWLYRHNILKDNFFNINMLISNKLYLRLRLINNICILQLYILSLSHIMLLEKDKTWISVEYKFGRTKHLINLQSVGIFRQYTKQERKKYKRRLGFHLHKHAARTTWSFHFE